MGNELNVGEVVKELSKPENSAELNQTLNDAFKEATTPAEPTADATPAENKQEEAPKGDEPSKQAGEDNKPKSRVEVLLEDRNAAKTEAANKQTEVQVLTTQVENLTKLIEDLKSGKANETNDAANNDDGADDQPMTKKEVDAYLERKLQERATAEASLANAEKSVSEQIQALETNKETPNAKDYANELKAIMAKHTSLSAYAAYRMLQGEGVIPMEGVNVSNANRTGTGNRSKTNLLDSKSAADMSQTEALSYLKGAEKSGDLNGLI